MRNRNVNKEAYVKAESSVDWIEAKAEQEGSGG